MRDLVEPGHGGRRVDGIHDVVERDGQRVNVFAVERRHEGPVQPLDDRPGPAVADVLDVLDGIGLRHVRRIDGQHLLQEPCAAAKLLGHADEVLEEALLARNQAKTGHVTSKRVWGPYTRTQGCNEDVTES